MKYLISVLCLSILALSGCENKTRESQLIKISVYPEAAKNSQLVKELMYYDPNYLVHKMPSFDTLIAQGVKLGYSVDNTKGLASYRVDYDTKMALVEDNIERLKSDFSTYIPQLAAAHASKADLFERLGPIGADWGHGLLTRTAEESLALASPLLGKSVNTEQLTVLVNKMSTGLGAPTSTEFVRAQYYDAFNSMPEAVTLYYLQSYNDNQKMLMRVGFHQLEDEWRVMGFGLEPATTD